VRMIQAITRVASAFHERRRSVREPVQFPAWVDSGVGSPPQKCTVTDVSEYGARITVEYAALLPKEIWVVFTPNGTVRRRCRVVWRSEEQAGVCYVGPMESRGLQN
jgi:hypothetical protein